eukprot:8617794-Pyramimonas_sp.AAC.1
MLAGGERKVVQGSPVECQGRCCSRREAATTTAGPQRQAGGGAGAYAQHAGATAAVAGPRGLTVAEARRGPKGGQRTCSC